MTAQLFHLDAALANFVDAISIAPNKFVLRKLRRFMLNQRLPQRTRSSQRKSLVSSARSAISAVIKVLGKSADELHVVIHREFVRIRLRRGYGV